MATNDLATQVHSRRPSSEGTKISIQRAVRPQVSPKKLEMFVSYASEDKELAEAFQQLLQRHLDEDEDYAHVWIDTQGLRAGFEIGFAIKSQLERSEFLIIVYTGHQKESHGFTGVEVGYFMGTHDQGTGGDHNRIVSFYLDRPPAPVADFEGLSFGITPLTLAEELETYLQSLVINERHPIVSFLRELEVAVDGYRRRAGLQQREIDVNKRINTVRELLSITFGILKQRKETEIHPQHKLIIDVAEDIAAEAMELPASALIRPVGAGTMAIFGMAEKDMRWSEFLQQSAERYRYVWKDAIETVVTSSLGLLNADNSQMVIGHNGENIYRLVLTQSTKYYNKRREFHLYFVEIFRRHDFGSDETTILLKALGICCRFRFMFFETQSEFSANNTKIIKLMEAKTHARKLIKELNLLNRDAAEAKLEDPRAWANLIDWVELEEMNNLYIPIDARMRAAANDVLSAHEDEIEKYRNDLVQAIKELEGAFHDRNGKLIVRLASKMATLPSLSQFQ